MPVTNSSGTEFSYYFAEPHKAEEGYEKAFKTPLSKT